MSQDRDELPVESSEPPGIVLPPPLPPPRGMGFCLCLFHAFLVSSLLAGLAATVWSWVELGTASQYHPPTSVWVLLWFSAVSMTGVAIMFLIASFAFLAEKRNGPKQVALAYVAATVRLFVMVLATWVIVTIVAPDEADAYMSVAGLLVKTFLMTLISIAVVSYLKKSKRVVETFIVR